MEDEHAEGVEHLDPREGLPVISTAQDVRSGASTAGLRRISAPLRCKVSGCTSDLASAPKTHQRFRLCNVHIKAPIILVDDVASRFCQQCSRFHPLQDFHGTNRTCRMMLVKNRARQRGASAAACGATSLCAATQKPFSTAVPLLFTPATTPPLPVLPSTPPLQAVGWTATAAVNVPAAITTACSPDASLAAPAAELPSSEPSSPHAWQNEPNIAESSATVRMQMTEATGGSILTAVAKDGITEPMTSVIQEPPAFAHSMPAAAAPVMAGAGQSEAEKKSAQSATGTGSPSPCLSQTSALYQLKPCLAARSGAAAVAAVEATGATLLSSVPQSPVGLASDAVQRPMPRSASALALSSGATALMKAVTAVPTTGRGASIAGMQVPALADAVTVGGGAATAVLGEPALPRTSNGCAVDAAAVTAASRRRLALQGCGAAAVPMGAADAKGMWQRCAAATSGAAASTGCQVSPPFAAMPAGAAAVRPSVPNPSPFARCSAPADLCHTAPGQGTLRNDLLEGSAWSGLSLPPPQNYRQSSLSQIPQLLEQQRVNQQQLHHQHQHGQVVRSRVRPSFQRELSLQQALRCGPGFLSQLCDLRAVGSGGKAPGGGGDTESGSEAEDDAAGCCAEDGTEASFAVKATGGIRTAGGTSAATGGGGGIFFRVSAPPEGAATPELTCADLRGNSVSGTFGRTSAVAAGPGSGLLGQGEPPVRGQLLLQRSGSSGSFKRRRSFASEAVAGDDILSVRPCSSSGVAEPVQDPGLAAAVVASEANLDARQLAEQQQEHRGQQQPSPMDCDGPIGPYNMRELRSAAAAAVAAVAVAAGSAMPANDPDSPDALHVGRPVHVASAGGCVFGRVSGSSPSPLGRPSSLPTHQNVVTAGTAVGADSRCGGDGGSSVPRPAREAPSAMRGLPGTMRKDYHCVQLSGTVAAAEAGMGSAAVSGVDAATDCDTLLLASLAAEWRGEDGPDCIDQLLLEGLEEAGAGARASADRPLSCMPQQSALALVPPPPVTQSLQGQPTAQVSNVTDAVAASDPRVAGMCALSRASWVATASNQLIIDGSAAAQSDTLRVGTLMVRPSHQSHTGNCSNDGVGIEKRAGSGGGGDAGWAQPGRSDPAVWHRSAQSEPAWWSRVDELQRPLALPHPLRVQNDSQSLLRAQSKPRLTPTMTGLVASDLAGTDASVPVVAAGLRPRSDDTISKDGVLCARTARIHGGVHDAARDVSAGAAAASGRETSGALLGTAIDNPVVRKAVGEETEEQLQLLLGDLIAESSAASAQPPQHVLTPLATTTTTTTSLTARQFDGEVRPCADPIGRLGLKPLLPSPSQLQELPLTEGARGANFVCCTLAGGIGSGGPRYPGVQLSLVSWGRGEADSVLGGNEGPISRDAAIWRTGVVVEQLCQPQEGLRQQQQPWQPGVEQVPLSACELASLKRMAPSAPAALDKAQGLDRGGQQLHQEPQLQPQQQQQVQELANGPQVGNGSSRRGGRRGGQQRSASPGEVLPDRDFLDQALRQQQALWGELRAMQEQQQALLQQQMEQQRALARLLRVGATAAAATGTQGMKSSSSDRSDSTQPQQQPQHPRHPERSSCGSAQSRPVPAFGRWSLPVMSSASDDPLLAQAKEDWPQDDSRETSNHGRDDPFARRSQQPDMWHRLKRQHAVPLLSEVSSAAPMRGPQPGSGGISSGCLDRPPANGLVPSLSAGDGAGQSLAHPRLAWVQQQM